ncbi:MAG TPA: hypothetical protein PKC39_14750 [Ferruginibacter sp.]|nr:hypothetical protein [Ferruginibacter sp.]HMP22216.1 hypothetical protein [Ferruginibacter sp.]
MEQKKEKIERKKTISEFIAANQLTLTEKEAFQNLFIAIDTNQEKLFYITYNNSGHESAILNLKCIKAAKVDSIEQNIYDEIKGRQVVVGRHVNKIQLQLSLKNNIEMLHYLPFYQAHVNGIDELNTLKKRAEYWQELITHFCSCQNTGKLQA